MDFNAQVGYGFVVEGEGAEQFLERLCRVSDEVDYEEDLVDVEMGYDTEVLNKAGFTELMFNDISTERKEAWIVVAASSFKDKDHSEEETSLRFNTTPLTDTELEQLDNLRSLLGVINVDIGWHLMSA